MANQKVGDFLHNLVKAYKEKQAKPIINALNLIFSNKSATHQQYFLTVDLEHQIRTLKTQHDSIWFSNLSELEKEQYYQYRELLTRFLTYYVEREKCGPNVIHEFKQFFLSTGNLLYDQFSQTIFRFTTKLILQEHQRIIKFFKKRAKDGIIQKFNNFRIICQDEQLDLKILSYREYIYNVRVVKELKLLVSNQQMKVHFMLYQFDRAAKCDKPAQEGILLEISDESDIITYYYYKGRINIFSSSFFEASECLQQVLQCCPNTEKGFKIQRQVLKYLIPVNMFLGKSPTQQMINYYKLPEYTQLCLSVRQGNIKLLQQVIDKYRGIWIKRSLLILLDQLKVLAYRNLCKKVWLINSKNKKINLDCFLTAFKFSHPLSQTPSIQEVCCIIANLIYLRLINGKIYQNNAKNIRALTLSDEPFKCVSAKDISWKS